MGLTIGSPRMIEIMKGMANECQTASSMFYPNWVTTSRLRESSSSSPSSTCSASSGPPPCSATGGTRSPTPGSRRQSGALSTRPSRPQQQRQKKSLPAATPTPTLILAMCYGGPPTSTPHAPPKMSLLTSTLLTSKHLSMLTSKQTGCMLTSMHQEAHPSTPKSGEVTTITLTRNPLSPLKSER